MENASEYTGNPCVFGTLQFRDFTVIFAAVPASGFRIRPICGIAGASALPSAVLLIPGRNCGWWW